MGNFLPSRNEENVKVLQRSATPAAYSIGDEKHKQKNSTNCPNNEELKRKPAKLNFRQISAISLGSLADHISGSLRLPSKYNSRRQKSKTNLNISLKNSKTNWPSPLSESIFLTHFKRISRNEEFQIESIIAEGAFGSVFKISEKINRQNYFALKVIKKSKIIEDNCVQQIKTEVEIQRQCGHHKFLVKQFDAWQNKSNLHILSEYLPNGEFFNINFLSCKFPLNLIRLYIAEIALALDFLHNAGVIYRDLKPDNILLTNDYHLKLTDFGLSKWLKFGEKTKTMCGTAQYMGMATNTNF